MAYDKFFSFILFFFLLILTGCGGSSNSGRKVAGICKSCKPYFVRGSWHYPQNYYEYDEVGLASWYGPGFHGKPKPYGEPFDQNAITAAHKTLPLPSIVKVTNLQNGESAIVLVDDRGPFVYEGRIIDLSVGTAKALGSYQKGIVKVRVQTLVSDSQTLSQFLTRYGSSGRDPSGRTWRQVYDQEIARKHHSAESLSKSSPKSSLKSFTKTAPKAVAKMVVKEVMSSTKNKSDPLRHLLT